MQRILMRSVAVVAAFWLSVGGAYASLRLVGVPPDMTLACDEPVPPAPMVLATGGCPAVVTGGLFGVTGLFLTETNANGIALMPDGRLVVAHDDHVIRYYNATGGLIEAVGGFGTATGRYNRPAQLAVDAQGRLHVADRDNHRVQTYRADGSYEGTFGSFGTATGQFNLIDGIAFGPAYTNLLIADRSNHRVQIYSLNENMVVRTLGGFGTGPGRFNAPGAVAEGVQGRIIVAELGGNRIQIFDPFWNYQGLLAGPGTAVTNLNFPRALATDTNGFIYAADTGNHRVLAWRPDGSLEGIFTGVGTSAGPLNTPQGLAVGLHGRLYVLEAGGRVLGVPGGGGAGLPAHSAPNPHQRGFGCSLQF
jgi:sugar lactone lactonase YvrE